MTLFVWDDMHVGEERYVHTRVRVRVRAKRVFEVSTISIITAQLLNLLYVCVLVFFVCELTFHALLTFQT